MAAERLQLGLEIGRDAECDALRNGGVSLAHLDDPYGKTKKAPRDGEGLLQDERFRNCDILVPVFTPTSKCARRSGLSVASHLGSPTAPRAKGLAAASLLMVGSETP